jgi:hypothetical protein
MKKEIIDFIDAGKKEPSEGNMFPWNILDVKLECGHHVEIRTLGYLSKYVECEKCSKEV